MSGLDRATLLAVYWQLRDHSDAYRETRAFKTTRERWQADRGDLLAYQKHVIHEYYARGVAEAARDVARMLGVPEWEIERPEVPAQ